MTDGGRVAFHVLGTGPPLAMIFPFHINHLELNWRVPLHRGAMEFLARHFTVITLDFRGAGLSDPLSGELSLQAFSDSLSAVLAEIGVARVRVVAMGAAGMIACHFAAHDPRSVERVVFISSGGSETNRQLLHMRRSAPDIEAHLRGALFGGVSDRRSAIALAEAARASLDPSTLSQWERLLDSDDAAIARSLTVPALYLHAADDQLVPLAAAERFLEPMTDARLMVVPGKSGMDVWRSRTAVDGILRFLQVDDSPVTRSPRTQLEKLANPAGLSEREVEVVRLLASGRTNRQIADQLFVSVNTVSHHLRNIYAKTGASNRTEAAAFAFESGLAVETRTPDA